MFPPMLLYVRVGKREGGPTGLWLPLFLVWLILAPIVAVAFVVAMLADAVLFLANASYHHYTLFLLGCLGVLAATRSTSVRVDSPKGIVDIDLV